MRLRDILFKKGDETVPFGDRQVRNALKIVFAGLIFYAAITHLGEIWSAIRWALDVLMPVLIGFAASFILIPASDFFERAFMKGGKLVRLKGMREKTARRLGVALCLIIAVAAVALVIVIVIPELKTGLESLAEILPGEAERAIMAADRLAESVGIELDLVKVGDIDWSRVTDHVRSLIPGGGSVFGRLIGTIGSVFGAVLDVVLGAVIGAKIAVEREAVGRFFRRTVISFFGDRAANGIFHVVGLSRKAFRSFMTGQVLEAASISILTFIGMLVFRFPYPAGVAAVMGVSALIPVFGAWIGAGFGTLMALTASPARALFFLIFIVVLQAADNTFIYPRIVGGSMKLNGLIVLAAVTVGGAAFGFAGMLLSVPAASVIYTLVNEAASRKTDTA